MTPEEYQDQIPHFCQLQTVKAHAEILMFCWSITHGYIKSRGGEGPQFCHDCEISIQAKRWAEVSYRKKIETK